MAAAWLSKQGPLNQRNLVSVLQQRPIVYIRFLQTELYGTSTVSYILHIVRANKLFASFLSIFASFYHEIDRIYLKINPCSPCS